ncbi:hypothetical protein CSC41_3414 [Pseudomonas aeruginosa]|nr:hypothetical protein CSC41_3414 [Pseudomonas aeruginosa]
MLRHGNSLTHRVKAISRKMKPLSHSVGKICKKNGSSGREEGKEGQGSLAGRRGCRGITGRRRPGR